MSATIRRLLGGALLAVVVGGLLLAGCTTAATPPSKTPAPRGVGGGTPIAPGYTPGANGRATVVGYVGRSTLEGGFWAAFDTPPGTSESAAPKVLAVLLPGKVTETSIAALEGRYVRATGRVQTGVSTRMAGPEVLVDSIEALSTR